MPRADRVEMPGAVFASSEEMPLKVKKIPIFLPINQPPREETASHNALP